MDFQNPSSSKLKATLTMFGGMVLGAMLSDGVMSVIHKATATTDLAAMKKESNMLLGKRVAVAGVSAYGAAAIKGEDTLASLAKGALYGMAGQQATKAVTHVVKTNEKVATIVAKSSFASAATGLSCPCTQPTPTLNRARTGRVRALRSPAYSQPMLTGSNIFENAISKGRMAVSQ